MRNEIVGTIIVHNTYFSMEWCCRERLSMSTDNKWCTIQFIR